jgi:hypothetical protein
MHLLTTPRPQMFFTWIIGLATVIAVVYPFSTTAPVSQKATTAVINLVLGTAIGSLINGTAVRVIRRRAITGGDQPGYPSSTLGNWSWYRFKTGMGECDLRFGRMGWLRQDRGSCAFDCFT